MDKEITEGKITLIKKNKGWLIHLDQQLGFSSELALTDKEMASLKRLIENYELLNN